MPCEAIGSAAEQGISLRPVSERPGDRLGRRTGPFPFGPASENAQVGEICTEVLQSGMKWVKVGASSDRTGVAGLLPLRHPRPG
jgi:hypothetical protein